jgi:hypothetical protein
MDDIRQEANYLAIQAAIAAVGITGLFIFEVSWVWLIFVPVAVFGLASVGWYLSRAFAEMKDDEPEEEAPVHPMEFIRPDDRPRSLVRVGVNLPIGDDTEGV